jgi:hypothetical protein
MTAKEKAQQLFYKYNSQTSDEFKSDTFKSAKIAQQCALIAVDEMIYETQFEVPNVRQKYWMDVKHEIEKL